MFTKPGTVMKILIKIFLSIFLLSSITANSFAQVRDTIIKEPKFKPPVVKTYLGVNQNGAKLQLKKALQLVALAFKGYRRQKQSIHN